MIIIYESFYAGNQSKSNRSLRRRCFDSPAEPEGTAVWPRSESKLWRPKPTFQHAGAGRRTGSCSGGLCTAAASVALQCGAWALAAFRTRFQVRPRQLSTANRRTCPRTPAQPSIPVRGCKK